ncbi:MAG: hypothetical protein MPK08_02435 [Alphaproteobacteria bacterium]|nr:hypothetical protein [Alphaproteobacteria bacterium]
MMFPGDEPNFIISSIIFGIASINIFLMVLILHVVLDGMVVQAGKQ